VKRLKRLIAKSERGALTPKELKTYRSLAQQAEQLKVARMVRKAILRALRQQVRDRTQFFAGLFKWGFGRNCRNYR
jgi:hypothetical protein